MSRSSFMPLAAISTRARPRQETAMPRRASRQWIGLGVGLALAVGTAAVPVAYAASPSPLPAIAQALNSATSYRIDLTQTDHNAAQPNERAVIVVVRTGKLVGVHVTVRYSKPPASQSAYTEFVVSGSKTCGRDGARVAFKCLTDPSAPSLVAGLANPAGSLGADGAVFTAVAATSIGGRSCAGYAFHETRGARDSGTLYVERTGRPCKIDGTTTGSSSGSSSKGRAVAIWSRFDDATLTIPRVG